jgi:(1->4)-alpha-D-glucan 1-alpha-D-glucosylmutase
MNATMTHDVKHAEDFRARVNVLSEIPDDWNACITRWSEWNADKRIPVNNHVVPEPNEEILLYQTLLGSWPSCGCGNAEYVKRIQEFMVKAGREAMVHTRWTVPNVEHENALTKFVEFILRPSQENQFLDDFREFAKQIAFHGALNSLSQVLVKIGSPGVADFYQGSELWDLRLVDPDNRQPVDYNLRSEQLAKISGPEASAAEMLDHWRTGVAKFFVTQRALRYRRDHSPLFLRGKYIPLPVKGKHSDSVFAFARHFRRSWAIIIVPRLTTRITKAQSMPLGESVWADAVISLPLKCPQLWRDILTGGVTESKSQEICVSAALANFPVALLSARP